MNHASASLPVEGRRRRSERCHTRPVAHVAAAMGIDAKCGYTSLDSAIDGFSRLARTGTAPD